jgi:thioredoxin-dependent peroxiredoxin
MHIGDLAPDFTLPDQHGRPVTLSTLCAEGPVVVFFYPAAMTAGCTKEACHFRDLQAAFAAAGAQRVGISMDDTSKQADFASTHAFDYPLLADVEGTVAKAYGVKRLVGLLKVRRKTFVIDRDRRILGVVGNEFNMNGHADEALAVLAARTA